MAYNFLKTLCAVTVLKKEDAVSTKRLSKSVKMSNAFMQKPAINTFIAEKTWNHDLSCSCLHSLMKFVIFSNVSPENSCSQKRSSTVKRITVMTEIAMTALSVQNFK